MSEYDELLLTDDEIDYEIKYVFEHNDLPIEVLLRPLIQSCNKAQLDKASPILKTIGFEAGLEQGIAEGKRLGKEAEDE